MIRGRAQLAGLVVLAVLVPRAAAADCEPPKLAPHELARPAIYLGDFPDLLGRHASWFWDPVAEVVLGPLDRDPWPDHHARVVPATSAVAGESGVVHLTAWVADPAHPGAVSGWFVSFAPDGQHAPLKPIIQDKLTNWYLLGALVNQPATSDDAYARVESPIYQTEAVKATRAIAGALSNHPTKLAITTIGNYRPRDLGGANIATLIALVDDLAAVAKLPAPAAPIDWTDYLPRLAASHAADLRDVLDDAMLGHPTPILPPVAGDEPAGLRCGGPTREQLRGPSLDGQITAEDVLALVRMRDARFAARAVAAFTGAAAGTGYVVQLTTDRGKHVAILAQSGGLTALAVTPAQAATLALGTRVDYVAHAATRTPYAQAPLDPAASVIELRTATRLRVAGVDPAAMLATVQARVRSGELPGALGASLAILFELADHVPGWSRSDARAYLRSLPGNAYDVPEQWAQAWHDGLIDAVADAPTTIVADELDAALPAMFARFAGRGAPLPAAVVRDFASELESAIALRRLAAGDLAGARAAIARASGPLAALATVTPVTAETAQDDNPALVRVTIGALIAAIARQPVTLPAPGERSQAIALVRELMQPYAPAVRDPWLHALVAAGMPKP